MARKARKYPPTTAKPASPTPALSVDDHDNGYASSTYTDTDNFEDAADGTQSEPDLEQTASIQTTAETSIGSSASTDQHHENANAPTTLLQPVSAPDAMTMATPRASESAFPDPMDAPELAGSYPNIIPSASAATVVGEASADSIKATKEPLSSAEIRDTQTEFDGLILDEASTKAKLLKKDESVQKEGVVPPSVGATSMLEPDETISNPFASGNQTPSEAPKQSNGRDVRDSVSSSIPPHTSDAGSKHFSVVSLSSTAASGSMPADAAPGTVDSDARRNTVTSSNDLEGSKESTSLPSGAVANYDFLLARLESQNKRLSDDPKSIRASIDGAVKLRENFEKLREQGVTRRSRTESQNRNLSDPASSQAGVSGTTESKLSRSSIASLPEEPQASVSLDEELRAAEGAEESFEDEAIDWEFWGDVMSNYQQVARTQPRQLSRAIQAGIPAALRGMMWQLMSCSKNEELEIIYAFYLKQTSTHEKAIRRDLNRTFPEQDYFKDGKGIGQENLYNVIKAYSLYDPEVGYCQGMQFVVGPLLLNMPDEEAFSTFVRLMKSYDLRGHFTPNMPALQLRLFQFDRLLEDFLPLLFRHLTRQGVKSSMYASQWFMTLFSYRFPLDLVYRILDSVFAEGVEALFRFAIALMRKNEDQLLERNFDQAVEYLKVSLFACYAKTEPSSADDTQETILNNETEYRTNEFVRDAFQIKITPFMLDQYAAEFDQQVRATNAHRREVDALRLVNRNLAARVKALEDQLNSVNAEHVNMVKDVVMAKIAKEEMAEDLVRYKMMYAEAVLQADQDSSNHRRGSGMSAASNSTSFQGHSYHNAFGTYNTSRQSS